MPPTAAFTPAAPTAAFTLAAPTAAFTPAAPTAAFTQAAPTAAFTPAAPTAASIPAAPTAAFIPAAPTTHLDWAVFFLASAQPHLLRSLAFSSTTSSFLTPIQESFGFLPLLAAESVNGFSVAAGQRHVRQRLFALSTAVACVLRRRVLLSRSKQSSSSTSGDRGGTRWAPPPSHLGVLSSLLPAMQTSQFASQVSRTGYQDS
jgi:hypothetical protein